MTTALSKVVEWQLEHPEGSKVECQSWLKAEVESGRLVVGESKRTNLEGGGKKKKLKT